MMYARIFMASFIAERLMGVEHLRIGLSVLLSGSYRCIYGNGSSAEDNTVYSLEQ